MPVVPVVPVVPVMPIMKDSEENETNEREGSLDFIRAIVDEDTKSGKHDGRVATRFPPEPNGYLHIGHAKSICLNFGVAQEYNGTCNLRFDDTNPAKEDVEYVDSIQEDVRWLGFDWDERLYYASDYFDKIYECAVKLIQDGKAYVDSLSAEEIRAHLKPKPLTVRSMRSRAEPFFRLVIHDRKKAATTQEPTTKTQSAVPFGMAPNS